MSQNSGLAPFASKISGSKWGFVLLLVLD